MIAIFVTIIEKVYYLLLFLVNLRFEDWQFWFSISLRDGVVAD